MPHHGAGWSIEHLSFADITTAILGLTFHNSRFDRAHEIRQWIWI
ncbi:MAG: hypothetical protein OJF61_000719 [Rhodanobacteraceae bacterium]|nr:MAG: hypothetical protein OJF61_000719 [Rhodanobacteraceae bacterium]